MSSVNKVIIVGRLGQDPEVRQLPNGDAVTNISVATSETWVDKQTGEKREVTEWHRIVFYRRNAEVAGQYLRKGSQLYVEGRLKTRKWTDPQTGLERWFTEIQGDQLTMLGSKADIEQQPVGNPPVNQQQQAVQQQQVAQQQVAQQQQVVNQQQAVASQDSNEDDVPF